MDHFTERPNLDFIDNPKEQNEDMSSITDSSNSETSKTDASEVQANPLVSAEVSVSTAQNQMILL